MKDKDNYRQLLAAKLEEIHLEETMPETMPSDEDLLRWERLANARRSENRRKFRRAVGIAAVFLLIAVIGVAAIVSPPDAEAGGDGKAVIVGDENKRGLTSIEYNSVEDVPKERQEKFVFFNEEKYELDVNYVQYTKSKNTEQIEVSYNSDEYGEIILTEIAKKDNSSLESISGDYYKKEIWHDIEVYIVKEPSEGNKVTYNFIYDNNYIFIYTLESNETCVKKLIEEAF